MIRQYIPSRRAKTPFHDQKTFIHGGDYNPDQWLPTTPNVLEEDAELMWKTGINTVSAGIFSWTTLEPTEGAFQFDWLDRLMDIQAKIGNRVILATPSGAMPPWLAERYPDARRVDERGHRAIYGRRHNHCWSSPSYHEKVRIINSKLAERYRNHPALAMWHVSNELSGQCFCDLCRKSWAAWLEKKYGTIKAMNDAHWAYFWAHAAGEWRHVEPTDWVMDGMVLNWHRFNNQQLIDWYTFEADVLRPITPDVPITTNLMQTTFGLNYREIAKAIDVVTDDQYPCYDPANPDFAKSAAFWSMKHDLYRCFKPDRTHMLMESCPGAVQWRTPQKAKRPGVHRLEMLQAIAHGADGTCYFQFRSGRGSSEKLHGAVVEHWGPEKHTQTRRYAELRSLSDLYAKLPPLLGTTVKPQVAVIYDWESRWGQHYSGGTGVRHPEWWSTARHYYDEIATEHYQVFWQRGIPVDVVGDDADFNAYKIVVLPMHWIMTPALSAKIRAYVQAGGTVVATWDTGMADDNNRMLLGGWPGEGLTDIFGLWVEEMDRLTSGTPRAIAGLPGTGGDVAALLHLSGAEVIATYAEDFYAGQPAVTKHRVGKGNAYYIGTRLDLAARDALYDQLIAGADVVPLLGNLPAGVTAQIRGVAGEGDKGDEVFLFLLNFSSKDQPVALGDVVLQNLDTGETVKGQVSLKPLGAEVYLVQ